MQTKRKRPILKIGPAAEPTKLGRLKKRNFLVGDPDDIVHMNWLSEWTEPSKFERIPRLSTRKK